MPLIRRLLLSAIICVDDFFNQNALRSWGSPGFALAEDWLLLAIFSTAEVSTVSAVQ